MKAVVRAGGRVDLEALTLAAGAVHYDTTLTTPEGAWQARVRVALPDGAVSFEPWQGDGACPPAPPTWLVALAHSVLRNLWKDRRGPDSERWPARVARWREAKALPRATTRPHGLPPPE